MAKATVTIIDTKKLEQQQAEITLRCLMHKARATKLALTKYCAK